MVSRWDMAKKEVSILERKLKKNKNLSEAKNSSCLKENLKVSVARAEWGKSNDWRWVEVSILQDLWIPGFYSVIKAIGKLGACGGVPW